MKELHIFFGVALLAIVGAITFLIWNHSRNTKDSTDSSAPICQYPCDVTVDPGCSNCEHR